MQQQAEALPHLRPSWHPQHAALHPILGEHPGVQVSECTTTLLQKAKRLKLLIFVLSHATKEAFRKVSKQPLTILTVPCHFRPRLQVLSHGHVVQVRECTTALLHKAKRLNVPVFVVGHVTKQGDIAGPRVLEHIVDVVLYLEGERFQSFRILRPIKNRHGPVDEVSQHGSRRGV